ncbi:MAG: T9SS type A sorting domain-containing protein, partial [Candidatus Eisenbacteria bacterium]|nr:T9SS type A sorting domain-containing protein [Candidatus Eisenbacteria bacterium]
SFADVFGVSTDFFVNGNSFNWLLGEDVTSPNIANDCLRNMENPDAANVAFNGQQPAHMDQFLVLTAEQDNGGVHINSGIPNRAYFLAADVIGIPAAEQIWYRALDQYLVRNSQFVDFRNGVIQAAEDLHGAGSSEVNAVIAGLDGVGIMGGSGTPPPSDLPDNTGTDFISAVDTDSGNIFRITPDFATVQNISGNSILASGRPSFTDNGEAFAWVSNENVFIANSDGSGQVQLSSSGGFSGVALGPQGRYLAANSIFEDGIIQVFDLVNSEGDVSFQLTSQNSTNGSVPDVVVGADVMEFTADGQFLIYDALNRTEFNGFQVEYWDINVIRLADGEVFRVFQALPQDESVGNPTFAQNNDNLIVFDYLTSDGNILVIAYDFNSNESGTVTNNFDFIGRPTFSGDDAEVFYEFPINEMPGIWRVTLNGLNGAMDDTNWAVNAANPVWFTIGTRPVPVRLLAMEAAWLNDGVHLTWEVADAHEVLGFQVERSAGDDFTRVNETLIASRGDNPTGEAYSFTDRQPTDDGLVTYRVVGVTRDGASVVLGSRDVRRPQIAGLPVLLPASPNPMRDGTKISLQIPSGGAGLFGTVSIYDVNGRKVDELFSGKLGTTGSLDLNWNGRDAQGRRVASGSYFVKLRMFDNEQTQKISVLP